MKTYLLSRRSFLKGLTAGGVSLAVNQAFGARLRYFDPTHVDNPLASYPNRGWEKVYRDIFKHDSSFVFLCAPNDTHNCLLKTYVKNGIAVRIGPTYGYGKATDLYGNQASHRWDPRLCQKGLSLVRRIYGDRRIKAPMVRKGFKEWVDSGFPRDAETGRPDARYFERGKDRWLRIPWDEAYDIAAKSLENIARTYSGKQGAQYLERQGYDPAMIEAMHEAGTQTIKLRGGMAFLGSTRIFGLYRFANMLALLDDQIRGVGPDKAKGARGWDSYSWHTDLPPGHPMVTGAQTNDFDLYSTEYSNLILAWGMNWITTKMPDSHWLTEARLKGAKTVAITVEYSATSSKCDEVVVIRPGTDPAFALGLAQTLIQNNWYDKEFVSQNTDLPFLIRMDTLKPLRPEEVIPGYTAPKLAFLEATDKPGGAMVQKNQSAKSDLMQEFVPYVVWDEVSQSLQGVTRDQWGPHFKKTGIRPRLAFGQMIALLNGKSVKVRSVFDLTAEYLQSNCKPEQTSKITGAPVSAIRSLARSISKNPEKTLFVTGMGPNQFFNSDLKDRAIFLVAALTRNVGFPGGNVGSYAGNYRAAIIDGEPIYAMEDPYQIQLEAKGPVKVRKYLGYESLHYFNYGDRPLRGGNALFTSAGHMPTPTKFMWLNNSNSVIGNVKWHYDVVHNTLPKIEFISFADWWWTGSCEYSDLVFGCDSWAEFKHPDMCASCTNPFVQMYPTTPIQRVFDTRSDIEIIAGVAQALAKRTRDRRMEDMWKFALNGQISVYLQRIIDHSSTLKGYTVEGLLANAEKGIPALIHTRTSPRASSYEQASKKEQPWHTKSGRLEFYRFESEFIDSGENMIVHREPVDSTPYEPNVIVAHSHEALRPKQPKDYGMKEVDVSTEARQVRNVIRTPEDVVQTQHPLKLKLKFTHVYHTPKYRHGAHTTAADTDYTGIWFGPFGDIYRHDKRMASVTEAYVDMNPQDARALGVDDGDYVYIDSDPEDRPHRNWKPGTEEYKISRLLLRVRYYPGTPRGIARTWHNMYGSTFGSVKGHENREDGLARNIETGYQSMYRYGSHQSATRAWLKPTLMTESLVRKEMFGQAIGKGFAPDIHCPVGAPRESFVKVTKAEKGGMKGQGIWRPAELGFRPTYENQAMKTYLGGAFMKSPKSKG
jgi:nitrate reductase alpha subunit